MILTVDLEFAINMQVTMWFPAVSWSDMCYPIHKLVILGWFLKVELVAREGKDGEIISINSVLFN
jgi:hypothetical protein